VDTDVDLWHLVTQNGVTQPSSLHTGTRHLPPVLCYRYITRWTRDRLSDSDSASPAGQRHLNYGEDITQSVIDWWKRFGQWFQPTPMPTVQAGRL